MLVKDHFVFAVKCPKRGGNHLLAIGKWVRDRDCITVGAMHLGVVAGFLDVEDEVYRDGGLRAVRQ